MYAAFVNGRLTALYLRKRYQYFTQTFPDEQQGVTLQQLNRQKKPAAKCNGHGIDEGIITVS